MLTQLLSILLMLIFFLLGLLHFNWALGGKWGMDKTIPTKSTGEKVLNPSKIDSAFVGFGLLLFGLIYWLKSGLLLLAIPNWILFYGSWIIPIIFILRAIGDFKYVGFFKKITNTAFANADSRIFSPLCLAIGLIGLFIQFQ